MKLIEIRDLKLQPREGGVVQGDITRLVGVVVSNLHSTTPPRAFTPGSRTPDSPAFSRPQARHSPLRGACLRENGILAVALLIHLGNHGISVRRLTLRKCSPEAQVIISGKIDRNLYRSLNFSLSGPLLLSS